MPGIKYNQIYEDLREKIEKEEYEHQSLMPSENILIKIYECSRNTLRRAIKKLANEGYVQSIQGKGVRVIYHLTQSTFMLGGIESLKEAAMRNEKTYFTKVILFEEIVVDEKISRKTSFPVGDKIFYIQRVRYIDDMALIIDHNYFRSDIVKGLSKEIANKSVYEYMENVLNEKIVTTKRKVTVERINSLDLEYLELNEYNCLAVVSSMTYNGDGIMFEYTQSRHRPDKFVFYDNAKRKK